MARPIIALAVAVAVACAFAPTALASCKTDADCPGSYCQNSHGPPPYNCHACGDFCCLTDAQCEAKCKDDGKGVYCQIYPGKHYPYWCHAAQCNITDVAVAEPVEPVVEQETEKAEGAGFKCWMCEKLLPYVGDSQCASKCSDWWPVLQGTCGWLCDELVKYLPEGDTCALAGYC